MSGYTRAVSRHLRSLRLGASVIVLGAALVAAGCSNNVSRFDYPMFANNSGDAGLTTASVNPVPAESIYSNGAPSNSTAVVRQDLPPPAAGPQHYGAPQAYAAAPPPPQPQYRTPPPYQPPAPQPVARSQPPAPPKQANKTVTVRSGDTLSKYSREYGVSVDDIKLANDMSNTRLSVGQKIVIPTTGLPPLEKGPSTSYAVKRGDTVSKIARDHDVSQDELIAANDLKRPYRLSLGQRLTIPGKAVVAKAKAEPVRVASADASVPLPSSKPQVRKPAAKPKTKVAARTENLPRPEPMAGNQFRWPVKGRIVSGFGPKDNGKHNDGINVAVPKGTSIKAAENGVVAYAGSELQPYGNLILIRHANNWVTAYAHNDALLVKRGDTVRRGQVIAKAGQSGNVSQPQLHFELRKGSKPVNPLSYMASSS